MNGNCIVCGSALRREDHLLTCRNAPSSAQEMPTEATLHQDSGIDLNVYQCPRCGLVQIDCEPVSYFRDVIRAGGYSSTIENLRRKEYGHFIQACGLAGKKIIEVGCGQGEFLKTLTEFPVEAYGVEHHQGLAEKAAEKGLCVYQGFAEDETVLFPNGPYDAFTSFNFLEHQPRPNDMIACIHRNLVPGGYGLVTVPCLEYLMEGNAFYEFVRDHIATYSLDTIRFLFEKNGFSVLEEEKDRDLVVLIVQKRKKLDVSGLLDNYQRLTSQMKEYTDSRCAKGWKMAVWGASHQAFTAISTTGVAEKFSYIIDSAPFKQGKYAPASHLRIVPPDAYFNNPVDSILIIAPGYTNEIASIIRQRFGENVEIKALVTSSVEDVP